MNKPTTNKPRDTVLIEAMSHEGRGIARLEGKTIFVDFALTGETAEINYHRKKSSFSEATALTITNPSPERVTPVCSAFQTCGGCSLQHWNSQAQVAHKQAVLLEQLQHFAGVTPPALLAPIVGPDTHYRRKARIGVRFVRKKQELLLGFREHHNGHFITDSTLCKILDESVSSLLPELKTFLLQLSNYETIPQIEIAVGDDAVALVVRHLEPNTEDDLSKWREFSERFKVRIYLQPKGLDSVWLLAPANTNSLLHYTLPAQDLQYAFHPCDFTQVNHHINQQMIARALELLDLQPTDRVLDLFCGLGNFSLPLAQRAAEVVGVEGDEAMVQRARENAALNHIRNCEFYAADLTHSFRQAPWASKPFTKILLDPPRSGAKEILKPLADLKAELILYISCNPASLARDTGELLSLGYKLVSTGILDMFPHTRHVESMALFARDH